VNVLALSPHTDDAEMGAGGYLRKLIEAGVKAHIVAFSIARDSVPAGFPNDVLIGEARASSAALGTELTALDYPVRRFPQYRQEILEELIKLKRELKPDIVLVHASTDIHQDHRAVYEEAVRAFKDTTLLGYEMPWNNLEFHAQAIVALGPEHIEVKIAALSEYKSQRGRHYANGEFIRGWARTRGAAIGVEYAEAFEVIRLVLK